MDDLVFTLSKDPELDFTLNNIEVVNEAPPVPYGWQPHPDWVIVPEPEENEGYILMSSIYEDTPSIGLIAITSAGQYKVDWGDGSNIEYYDSGVQANHTYTSGGKDCALGYKTWLIKVSAVSGNIASFRLAKPSYYQKTYLTSGVLVINTNFPYATIFNSMLGYSVVFPLFVQYIKFGEILYNSCSFFNAFYLAYNLEKVILPKNIYGNITSLNNTFFYCRKLKEVENLQTIISKLVGPIGYGFFECTLDKKYSLVVPSTITDLTQAFNKLIAPQSEIEIQGATGTPGLLSAFHTAYIKKVKFTGQVNATNITNVFYNAYMLETLEGTEYIGSQTSNVDGTNLIYYCSNLTSPIVLYAKFTKLGIYSMSGANNPITSIRLMNPNSPYSGTSPQIDVSYNLLDATALNTLFGDLPVLSGKTIKITGNPGAATCDTSIATSKGWTVQN